MGPAIREILGTGAASFWFWMAWKSVRTGSPGGSLKIGPRRSERAGYFWFVVALYVLVAFNALLVGWTR